MIPKSVEPTTENGIATGAELRVFHGRDPAQPDSPSLVLPCAQTVRFDFCLPTKATIVPDGPNWPNEVKCDSYQLRLERDGDHVRPITRGGHDWPDRYPWIVKPVRKNRHRHS